MILSQEIPPDVKSSYSKSRIIAMCQIKNVPIGGKFERWFDAYVIIWSYRSTRQPLTAFFGFFFRVDWTYPDSNT